jgi:hypothetical protein
MEKIKTVIFSFNRPAQLDNLLDSIEKFDINKKLDVIILYSFSDENLKKGYDLLILKYPNSIFTKEERYLNPKTANPFFGSFIFNLAIWIKNFRYRNVNSNFKKLLLGLIEVGDYKYIMFLTDDSQFYDEIKIKKEILEQIAKDKSCSYSLSLGSNIDGYDIYNINNVFTLTNNNDENNNDWTYSFSVDGRIYSRDFMYSISQKLIFSNPNTFESIIVKYNVFNRCFRKVFFNTKSCLVGFELNRVQNVYSNNNLKIDEMKINKYYLDGYNLVVKYNKEEINTFRPQILDVRMVRNNTEIGLLGNI